jgi:hypothetical protein
MRQSHCPASLIQRQTRQGHGLRPLSALDRSGVCWIGPLDIDLGAEVKITSHTDFLTLPGQLQNVLPLLKKLPVRVPVMPLNRRLAASLLAARALPAKLHLLVDLMPGTSG